MERAEDERPGCRNILCCKGMLCLLRAALSPRLSPLGAVGARDVWLHPGHLLPNPVKRLGLQCLGNTTSRVQSWWLWGINFPFKGALLAPASALDFQGAAAGRGSPRCCLGDEETTVSGGSAPLETLSHQHYCAQQHPPNSHKVPNAHGAVGEGCMFTLQHTTQCEPQNVPFVLWAPLSSWRPRDWCLWRGTGWIWGSWGLQIS